MARPNGAGDARGSGGSGGGAGVRLERGDILLARTSKYLMPMERRATCPSGPLTAHQAACGPWFRELGIETLRTNTSNDVRPNPRKTIGDRLRTLCLVSLGPWFIDNATRMSYQQHEPPGALGIYFDSAISVFALCDRLPGQSHRAPLGAHLPSPISAAEASAGGMPRAHRQRTMQRRVPPRPR